MFSSRSTHPRSCSESTLSPTRQVLCYFTLLKKSAYPLAVEVNKLLDNNGRSSGTGPNPFEKVTFKGSSGTLANVVPLKTPAGADSKATYASIANNIETWIEEAIRVRENY